MDNGRYWLSLIEFDNLIMKVAIKEGRKKKEKRMKERKWIKKEKREKLADSRDLQLSEHLLALRNVIVIVFKLN